MAAVEPLSFQKAPVRMIAPNTNTIIGRLEPSPNTLAKIFGNIRPKISPVNPIVNSMASTFILIISDFIY